MAPLASPPADLPGLQILARDPLLYVIDGFASDAECDALLAAARSRLEPPLVSRSEMEHDPSVRTGQLAWLAWSEFPAVEAYCARVARLVGWPLDDAESLQVVRYLPGQRYQAHYDAYDQSDPAGRSCLQEHGQRFVTTLTYLHEPDAGGATTFDRLGLAIPPRRGQLVAFADVGADPTRPHPDSLHAGAPVEAGVKWMAALWFRRPLPGA